MRNWQSNWVTFLRGGFGTQAHTLGPVFYCLSEVNQFYLLTELILLNFALAFYHETMLKDMITKQTL